MLKSFLSRQIDKMERQFGYDATYMRDMLRISPGSFVKFGMLTQLVDRGAAPGALLAAAGIAATLVEDCGPCTQISVDMATAGGLDPAILRGILAGDVVAMGNVAALGWRFAQASMARDMETADPLRDEIIRRWGEKGLLAVSLAITTGRMYPTVKYALGYGKACSRVTVAGEVTPVAHIALAA
jgi:hypothetical protein